MFKIREVGRDELRRIFKELKLHERLTAGELSSMVVTRAPASRRSNQPPGTESQEVAYFDGRTEVARVHQFVLPDGSIGASGKPDPKAVLDEGTLYVLAITPRRSQ